MERPKVKEWKNPLSECDFLFLPTYDAGHLVEENSSWRTFRPVIDEVKCTKCLRCFLVCPDGTIDKSGEVLAIDYSFCKGCGICARECKLKAITMIKEVGGK